MDRTNSDPGMPPEDDSAGSCTSEEIQLLPATEIVPDTAEAAATSIEILEDIQSALKKIMTQGRIRGSRSNFIYAKIAKELEKGQENVVIRKLEDLKKIKYVKEKTYERIKKVVRKMREAEKDKQQQKAEECTRESSQTLKKRRTKEYIPGYRTAPYAVLRAIYEMKSGHKYLLALKAAPFTDSEFSATQKFSAFGAFKMLERHSLICSEGRGRYSLTEKGEELAGKMFSNLNDPSASPETDPRTLLVIDSREKKSNRERTFFQEYFTEHHIDCCTRFLGLGDFLWIREEKVLGHIIERKAGSDLLASVSDGRFREQKRRLKLFNMQAYLLVEKLAVEPDARHVVEHAMMEARMDGLVVLETESIQESGWVIKEIDRKVREEETNYEVASYGSFIDEGSKTYTAGEMFLSALLSIKGVSKKAAVKIQERFLTLAKFLRSTSGSGFVDELASIRVDGRILGEKLARRIISLMS